MKVIIRCPICGKRLLDTTDSFKVEVAPLNEISEEEWKPVIFMKHNICKNIIVLKQFHTKS